jgi:guanylate kinase
MKRGLILYGAPATGKDTVTAELVRRDSSYVHFERLKLGGGRTSGYRMISPSQADELRRKPGEILWENSRYGATYFVDRRGLEQIWALHKIPVVHLGQAEAIDAITGDVAIEASWTVVELYCRPAILHDRIRSRATGDEEQRFAAIEQTPRLTSVDVRIDTESVSAAEAAELISQRMRDQLSP